MIAALEGLDASSRDPVPGLRWRADRHQQLSPSRVDAGRRGDGDRAPADLRPAPHVRDVEPGGGRRHLHAGPADGHEREDDRPHVRAPDRGRGHLRARAAGRLRRGPFSGRLDAIWTRKERLMPRSEDWRRTVCPMVAGFLGSGASRDRTGDLLLAKQALSHLSYGPAGASSLAAVRSAFRPATGPDREDRRACGRHFDGIGSASCVGEREARESLPLATEGQAHRGRACGAMTGRQGAPALAFAGVVLRARSRPRRAGPRPRRRARARRPRT